LTNATDIAILQRMLTPRTTIAAILFASCSSAGHEEAPPGDAPPAIDASLPSPDAAPPGALQDPSGPGPWKVGVHTVQLTDPARNRTFATEVWYPIDPATTNGKANEYKLESLLGTLASIASPARRDATPLAGTFPLVLFSHGFGGIRFQSYFATERLASHGFVVVAPDHPGNTLADFTQLGNNDAAAQSAIDRPLDMEFSLAAALAGQLGVAVAIDPAHIAATGHSFGGWTCLETARRDPRIRAVFPMAPGFRNGATDDFVATLARPLLFVGGSADHTCDFAPNQQDPYDKAASPKYLLELMGAGHLDFSNLCEVPLAKLFVKDGCDPQMIDPDVVHARTNRVATAFALRYLRDDARYDAFLDVAGVSALGNVQFWAAP
jgi:predicted dienelactone hydrolase